MPRVRLVLVVAAPVCLLIGIGTPSVGAPTRELMYGPDVNRDSVVHLFDLTRVAARCGTTSHGGLPADAPEDTNGDGVVCISDLVCVSVSSHRGLHPTPVPSRTLTPPPLPTLTTDCEPARPPRSQCVT
jgi:hypothetical protein